jgi:hypothetical protein
MRSAVPQATVDVTVAIVGSLTVASSWPPAVAGLTRDQLDKQIAQARNRARGCGACAW